MVNEINSNRHPEVAKLVKRIAEEGEKINVVQQVSELRNFFQSWKVKPDEDLQLRRKAVDQAIDENVPPLQRKTFYDMLWEKDLSNAAYDFAYGSSNEEKMKLAKDPLHLKHIRFALAQKYPDKALATYAEFRDEPYAHDMMRVAIQSALESDPGEIIDNYQLVLQIQPDKAKDIVCEAFRYASRKDPLTVLKRYPSLADAVGKIDKRYIVEAAERLSVRNPNEALEILEAEYSHHNDLRGSLSRAKALVHLRDGMKDRRSFGEKIEGLQQGIATLIPEFQEGLKRFNESSGWTLECMGIGENSRELLLINTLGSYLHEPVLIRLNVEELFDAIRYADDPKGKAMGIESLIRKKGELEQKAFENQTTTWRHVRDPEGMLTHKEKTGVLIVTAPGHLENGIEKDATWWAEYLAKQGVPLSKMRFLMERKEKWDEARNRSPLPLPEADGLSSKANILRSYEDGIREAIRRGDKEFVFFFMLHGSPDGTMEAAGKEKISANEFAAILAKRDEATGKCLGELIDVTELAESCFSGSQLEKKQQYLRERKVPIRNLRSIAATQSDSPGGAHLNPNGFIQPLLFGNRMLQLKDKRDYGLTITHYLSYYDELTDYLRKREAAKTGIPAEKVDMGVVGSFSHAVQFADRMAREENNLLVYKQNPVGIHYSTHKPGTVEEPTVKKLTDTHSLQKGVEENA